MDFGLSFALLMLGGRLIARSERKEAELDYNSAVLTYRSANSSLVSARDACFERLQVLGENRLACIGWQLNHIRRATDRVGVTQQFFSQRNGIFSGRTLSQVMALVRAAQKTFIPPTGLFDTTVMLSSGAAVIVEGVQYLDKVGVVDAPMLHNTLNEVIGSLPVDQVHGMTDALGGVGLMNIGDLLGDALVVFGAFKVLYNLAKADTLGTQASYIRSEASRLRDAAGIVGTISQNASILTDELDQRSYDAYKWTIITEEAAKLQRERPGWQVPQIIVTRLREASIRLWSNLQQPAAA